MMMLGGCRGAPETPTQTALSPSIATATLPAPSQTFSAVTASPETAQPSPLASSTQTVMQPAHPGPQVTSPSSSTATLTGTSADQSYPGPQPTSRPARTATSTSLGGETSTPYPGPVSSPTPRTPSATRTPTALISGSLTPSPTYGFTPTATLTSTVETTPTISPTPTEFVGQPIASPPPSGQTLTLWHSWNQDQTQALERVIESFQEMAPNISFDVLYIPEDELQARYEEASYYGEGPDLLLAPAEWGGGYYSGGLVADIAQLISSDFLATINQPALGTMRYQEALIGLPYATRGFVLYRNNSIIPQAPETFDQLVSLSQSVSQIGVVGAYLDRGSLFSSGHLYGLGGRVMDANGDPAFNDSYGLAWIDLLTRYEEAGPAGLDTNRDIDLFKEGKAGLVIEGSWNWPALSQAIGSENLFIDPWPSYEGGKLAGYVQCDSIYMNTNIDSDKQASALQFMGYLLDPDVQKLMAEVGFIPAALGVQPRDAHVQQVMQALFSGVSYPVVPDERFYSVYWSALDSAIYNVFEQGMSAQDALQAAYDFINVRLAEIRGGQ